MIASRPWSSPTSRASSLPAASRPVVTERDTGGNVATCGAGPKGRTRLPATAWWRYRILEGSKGPLVADFAVVRAIAVRDRGHIMLLLGLSLQVAQVLGKAVECPRNLPPLARELVAIDDLGEVGREQAFLLAL